MAKHNPRLHTVEQVLDGEEAFPTTDEVRPLKRIRVAGGWLYQMSECNDDGVVTAMALAFVPDVPETPKGRPA